MSADQVLFLTDVFPTGYSAIEWTRIETRKGVRAGR